MEKDKHWTKCDFKSGRVPSIDNCTSILILASGIEPHSELMISPRSLCRGYPVIRGMSCLVLLAALLTGDLVTAEEFKLDVCSTQTSDNCADGTWGSLHVLGETIKVLLLLLELLLELNELLLLALADSIILVSLLPSLEGITRE
jgi:hypothetical protein